jgi:ATP-dependent DNA helicase PIF1
MSLYETSNDFDDSLLDNFRDLIIDYNKTMSKDTPIPVEYPIDFSDLQKLAFEKFKKGENLLILGAGGVGKSKLVKEFYKYTTRNNKNKTMYITSTTGISAYNIGGITINSFMHMGTGAGSVQSILNRLRYKINIKNRIKNTDILVIDEISMMSCSIFEKINSIFQILRKSSKPFGGIQLILTGDFLQLETVFDKVDENTDTRLIVESELFTKLFANKTILPF